MATGYDLFVWVFDMIKRRQWAVMGEDTKITAEFDDGIMNPPYDSNNPIWIPVMYHE